MLDHVRDLRLISLKHVQKRDRDAPSHAENSKLCVIKSSFYSIAWSDVPSSLIVHSDHARLLWLVWVIDCLSYHEPALFIVRNSGSHDTIPRRQYRELHFEVNSLTIFPIFLESFKLLTDVFDTIRCQKIPYKVICIATCESCVNSEKIVRQRFMLSLMYFQIKNTILRLL